MIRYPRRKLKSSSTNIHIGRAIAQVASRRLPTASGGFEPRSCHEGFVIDKVALKQVFCEYFGFRYQFSFHWLLHIHHHHLSPGAGRIGQLLADVRNRLSLTATPAFILLFCVATSSVIAVDRICSVITEQHGRYETNATLLEINVCLTNTARYEGSDMTSRNVSRRSLTIYLIIRRISLQCNRKHLNDVLFTQKQ
jgi:hypothetical protein